MTYKEKAKKFKDMVYRANLDNDNMRWRNRDELDSYLVSWGGRLKEDLRRRRGYLVSFLQDSIPETAHAHGMPRLVAEVPMEFAMKVLSLGGFP